MDYKTFVFENEIDLSLVPVGELCFFNWESETAYRPKASFRLAFSKSGLKVKMECNETELRAFNTAINSPCWEDSCLEFFFAPFGKGNGYINIEVNPRSAYLAQFGKGRDNRVFVSELTGIAPDVRSAVFEGGWGTEISVSYTLIEAVFKKSFDPLNCDFYTDFFKCGDLTSHPHYASFTPMGALPPGFHNPECFAKITITPYEH